MVAALQVASTKGISRSSQAGTGRIMTSLGVKGWSFITVLSFVNPVYPFDARD